MTDQTYSFDQVKTRLEDIVTQVRRKDIALEKSLELLEEGVRLANLCNDLVDQATPAGAEDDALESADQASANEDEAAASDPGADRTAASEADEVPATESLEDSDTHTDSVSRDAEE